MNPNDKKTTVDLSILAYEAGAMYDSFDDGGFQIFDHANVQVIDGVRAGQTLSVWVDGQDREQVAMWNRPGGRLRTLIDDGLLGEEIALYSTAFTVVEVDP